MLSIPEGLLVLVTIVAGVNAWRAGAVDWIAMCSREDPDCAIGSVWSWSNRTGCRGSGIVSGVLGLRGLGIAVWGSYTCDSALLWLSKSRCSVLYSTFMPLEVFMSCSIQCIRSLLRTTWSLNMMLLQMSYTWITGTSRLSTDYCRFHIWLNCAEHSGGSISAGHYSGWGGCLESCGCRLDRDVQ